MNSSSKNNNNNSDGGDGGRDNSSGSGSGGNNNNKITHLFTLTYFSVRMYCNSRIRIYIQRLYSIPQSFSLSLHMCVWLNFYCTPRYKALKLHDFVYIYIHNSSVSANYRRMFVFESCWFFSDTHIYNGNKYTYESILTRTHTHSLHTVDCTLRTCMH